MDVVLKNWQEMPFIKNSWFYMKNIFFDMTHHNICGEHVGLI